MKFSKRSFLVLILFGLIGQVAWSVENMFFNSFMFETMQTENTIGNAINKALNIPLENPGADAMTTTYVPAPHIFLAAAAAAILIPLLIRLHEAAVRRDIFKA